MSKEAFVKCWQQYKTGILSPDDCAQLTEPEALKLAVEIVSDMSAESKDAFMLDYFLGIYKITQYIKAVRESPPIIKEW